MNSLKLRVELNKGKEGISLGKLADIAKKTQQFLASASEDIGLVGDPGDWVAHNFKNGSVNFDCSRTDEQPPEVIDRGHQILRNIMENDRFDPELNLRIRPVTRLQYTEISKPLTKDESISLGLYPDDGEAPSEWFNLTKDVADKITEEIPQTVQYHGEIQGIIHAFYKESKRPRVSVRELSTNALVDCFFEQDMYQEVVELLREPDAVFFVEGEVTEDQQSGRVKSIKVVKFHRAPDFDKELYERFIGSKPNYTGELSTMEHIEAIRDDRY